MYKNIFTNVFVLFCFIVLENLFEIWSCSMERHKAKAIDILKTIITHLLHEMSLKYILI